jgi:hypothetical protein
MDKTSLEKLEQSLSELQKLSKPRGVSSGSNEQQSQQPKPLDIEAKPLSDFQIAAAELASKVAHLKKNQEIPKVYNPPKTQTNLATKLNSPKSIEPNISSSELAKLNVEQEQINSTSKKLENEFSLIEIAKASLLTSLLSFGLGYIATRSLLSNPNANQPVKYDYPVVKKVF